MSEKTHAEIIEEMNCGPIPEHRHDREFLRYYAYELEAAHKREVDALKQRCAELNAEVAAKDEVIKRLNAEVRKNQEEREIRIAAQKAKAAAEGYADGKRDAQVGNAAKLREALCDMLNAAFVAILRHGNASEEMGRLALCADNARAALAAPARNCDVGTAKEQSERFNTYCFNRRTRERCCEDCPIKDAPCCELAWAQMPCESEAEK